MPQHLNFLDSPTVPLRALANNENPLSFSYGRNYRQKLPLHAVQLSKTVQSVMHQAMTGTFAEPDVTLKKLIKTFDNYGAKKNGLYAIDYALNVYGHTKSEQPVLFDTETHKHNFSTRYHGFAQNLYDQHHGDIFPSGNRLKDGCVRHVNDAMHHIDGKRIGSAQEEMIELQQLFATNRVTARDPAACVFYIAESLANDVNRFPYGKPLKS